MATNFPKNFDDNHPSEVFVYQWVKNNLPNHWIAYFNYFIETEECDLILLIPNYGILTIEIKSWKSEKIISVVDQNEIVYKKKNELNSYTSPYRQARRYSHSLIQKIKSEYDMNIVVVPAVCYVNISTEEFNNKGLRIICEEDYAILQNDFKDSSALMKKLLRIIEKQKEIGFDFNRFSENEQLNVRKIFEENPEFIKWDGVENEVYPTSGDNDENVKYPYSKIVFIPNTISNSEKESIFIELLKDWKKGTKVLLASNEELDHYKKLLWNYIKEIKLEKYKPFNLTTENEEIYQDYVFNFSFYQINFNCEVVIQVLDGDKVHPLYDNLLTSLHEQTLFNKDQFEVEHAPLSTNLLIKAGAGSGKTHSMISRLTYLVNKHDMDANRLYASTYLITFTNEAAANMKKRLQETLQNYYLLTRNFRYFELVEHVRNLNISTIHSLSKRIVQKFSMYLGLGKDVSIATGIYERNQFLDVAIEKNMDKYFKNDYSEMADLNISMHELKKRIKSFINKLENQNIDIHENLDLGIANNSTFGEMLKSIIVDTEFEMKKWLIQNNKVRLSDLMKMLKEIIFYPEKPLEFYKGKIQYVFVDEFQDTDNVQIDLIKEFQKQLGFSLFVVGDVKQSIYRFRGAESKAFDRLIPPDSDDTSIINKWGEAYTFNKNYRTDSLLLERLEKSFNLWGEEGLLTYKKNKDKLFSQKILNNTSNDFYIEEGIKKHENFEDKFIQTLNHELATLPENQTIAILVRDNLQIEQIKEICLQHNIYIEVDKGGNFYKSQPVLDLYKMILALIHFDNPSHLANLFTTSYVKKNLSFKALLETKLNKQDQVTYFHKLLEEQHNFNIKSIVENELKIEPVLSVLWKIRSKILPWNNYVQKYNFKDKEQTELLLYYKRNLDLAFEKFIEVGNTDHLTINKLEQFLRIMIFSQQESQEREIFDLSEKARLVCTTVHKAKGLEFHTVILPFNNKEIKKEKILSPVEVLVLPDGGIGYSIQLQAENDDEKFSDENYVKNDIFKRELKDETIQRASEETRVLYVATTRAIKKLIYFTQESKAKNSWQLLLQKGIEE
jgi:DNA helicase II / ATP-dependent DNA helicase PcrA